MGEEKKNIFFEKNEWVIGGVKLVFFLILPVAAFYLMEFYRRNPFKQIRQEAHLFNILIFELIAWILFFITGRAKWAIRILWILAMVFGLTDYYVMEFRSTPFVPWDLFSVGTASKVAGNYDFTPTFRVVIITLIFIAGIVLAGVIELRMFGVRPKGDALWRRLARLFGKLRQRIRGIRDEDGRETEENKGKNEEETTEETKKTDRSFFERLIWLWRFIPALLLFLVLSGFVGKLQKEDFQNAHNLYPFLFTPSVMTKYNGLAVTFAMDLAYVVVEKPSGYSADEQRARMEEYRKKVRDEKKTAENKDLPNIIVIMDEAFSDLGVLGDAFATEQDVMPFVHSLQKGNKNTITGLLNVSVCGGNTANTEFEFLTGNSMAFLPTGSIPYQQYIKKPLPSLASHLRGLGYYTAAVHPYNASGWCRDTVYPLLGFERFDSLKNFAGVSYIRDYVSDRSDFDKIKEIYQKNKGRTPGFIFNVTMQNHGSYTELFDNFTPDVRSNAGNGIALHQYLSLIRQTDQAFKELIDYFSKEEEKTVIVFFGDHQPADSVARPVWQVNGVDDSNLTTEQMQMRYQVPYVVWANYAIPQATGQDTSVNYLAQRVLKAAGVPLSDYERYLSSIEKDLPLVSALCREGSKEVLNDYQKMQYYQMFDRKEEQ